MFVSSEKLDRQCMSLFQWPATSTFASGAGRHGWAPTNSDYLYCGDGGVCVWVCVCVMRFQYTIEIFDPG